LVLITLASGASTASARKNRYIPLPAEQRTTIHVGQSALLAIPSDYHYSIGESGHALAEARRSRRGILFRGVKPGLETIILSPDVPDGHCISCATVHYFVTVVPETN